MDVVENRLCKVRVIRPLRVLRVLYGLMKHACRSLPGVIRNTRVEVSGSRGDNSAPGVDSMLLQRKYGRPVLRDPTFRELSSTSAPQETLPSVHPLLSEVVTAARQLFSRVSTRRQAFLWCGESDGDARKAPQGGVVTGAAGGPSRAAVAAFPACRHRRIRHCGCVAFVSFTAALHIRAYY